MRELFHMIFTMQITEQQDQTPQLALFRQRALPGRLFDIHPCSAAAHSDRTGRFYPQNVHSANNSPHRPNSTIGFVPSNASRSIQIPAVHPFSAKNAIRLSMGDSRRDGFWHFKCSRKRAMRLWPLVFLCAAAYAQITPVSVEPSAGGATTQNFSFVFTDPNGPSDLSVVNILINDALDGRHACYLAFTGGNTLNLVDDAGDAAGPFATSPMSPTL